MLTVIANLVVHLIVVLTALPEHPCVMARYKVSVFLDSLYRVVSLGLADVLTHC